MQAAASSSNQTMLDAALAYLEDEWSVFPVCSPSRRGRCEQHGACKHPGKTPLARWGTYQDRLPSRDEVVEWWTRMPRANIGLATGELSDVVVVDIDGEVALAEAIRRGFDAGPWVRTGRAGGRHLYFRYRKDAPTIFAKTGGIDFRGQGGFVLLPPSRHATGALYDWGEEVGKGDPLPDLPRWIDDLANTALDGTPRGKVDFGRLFKDGLSEGVRDQELFRAAAKLRGVDVPYDVALRVLQQVQLEAGSNPFTPEEVRAKVDSAYGRYLPNATIQVDTADEVTAADLVRMTLPEPRWAVPGVWPEGVVLLVGKSKLGKSWLTTDAGLAVAEGGLCWGSIEVEQGDVLMLALEDSQRRLQDRLRMLRGGEAPAAMTLKTRVGRSNEGGIDYILGWLDKHPRARLIVIDVLGKFRAKEANQRRLYDLDYEAIAPIAEVARARGVCVLVVHHANKLNPEDPVDSVSGTTGLAGAADAICIFRRERGKADASLFVVGRDVEEQDLAFKGTLKDSNGQAWTLIGDAAEFRLSEQRRKILDALTREPGMTPSQLAGVIGCTPGAAKQRLWHMREDGMVRDIDGHYYPDFALHNPHNPRNRLSEPVTVVTSSYGNTNNTPVTPVTRNGGKEDYDRLPGPALGKSFGKAEDDLPWG